VTARPPIVDRLVDLAAIAAFTGMFGCVLAQVVFRYVFNDPLVWSDELARYLFVWTAFLGWIIAARRRSHLAVGMLVTKLPPKARVACHALAALVAIAFAAALVFYGTRIMLRNLDVDTASLWFPMGVVYLIVPLAAFAVGLYALADLRAAFRGPAEAPAP
jgi:TRAP-type C4-dicarboxylate transport system permease small subunit